MHDKRLHPQPASALSLATPETDLLTATTVLATIATWIDLTADKRSHLASDVRTVARMAGLPVSNVVLTPPWLRAHVLNESAASRGVSEYRLRNLRSSLRFVLRRLEMMDPAVTPLSPDDRTGTHEQTALTGLARFCSLRGIPPRETHDVADRFLAHLVERTLTPKPRKLFGRVRNVWNRCCATIEDWPGQPLRRPTDTAHHVLPIEAFPESFRMDLATFGERLAGTSFDDANEEPSMTDGVYGNLRRGRRPLRAISVALGQSHIRWAASALVAAGEPIAGVTSLESLVNPVQRVGQTLRFLHERAGGKGSAAGMHVRVRYDGMTEKNETTVRRALLPHHEEKLRALPMVFLEQARKLLPDAPLQACSLALRATAIGLLLRRPLRLANVIGLRLDRHLQRAEPRRGRITSIWIEKQETKNTHDISLPIAPDIARLLEEWVTRFRPIMAAPECRWLFPGQGTSDTPITPQGLRDAVKAATSRYVGVILTPHQFRHLAARAYLQEHPGDYETVRQLLGHRSLATTIRHYAGIEIDASFERFDEIVLNRRRRHPRGAGRASRTRRQ